jgi:hypothetical protein
VARTKKEIIIILSADDLASAEKNNYEILIREGAPIKHIGGDVYIVREGWSLDVSAFYGSDGRYVIRHLFKPLDP